MCIYIDMIWIGIVRHKFLNICTRVMALYLRQNFVSALYLENQLVEFHQILYMHLSWQNVAWDVTRHFSQFVPEFWSLI